MLSGFTLLWWLGVTWGIPAAIRAAHAGRLPLPDGVMSGRQIHPVEYYVEHYIDFWLPIARGSFVVVLTSALLLLGTFLLARYGRHRVAGEGPPARPPASAGALLLIGVWCGLLTGVAEAYYLVLRTFYQHQVVPHFFDVSQHAVWMSPLANLAVFAVAGGVLVVGGAVARGRLDQRTAVAALVGLGVFGVVMATDRLHWAAAVPLSLGIAVQTHGILTPGAGEVARLARRSVGWLVAVIVCLGFGVKALEVRREHRQLAAAGTPAPAAPNVLFIVLDTERAASTSLHGASRPTTPFLEELARQGAMFEWAIAPTSWTLPSHAAMFTGRETGELGVDWHTPLDDRYPTLAEALSAAGYATAGFVANPYFGSDFFGLDRGFGLWEDQPILPGIVTRHSWLARSIATALRMRLGNHQELGRKTADAVNASFLHWLDRPRQRPFFAFLNYIDVHLPYRPPEPWNVRFATTQPRYWLDDGRKPEDYSETELAELKAAYDGSIAYLDDRLRRLFKALGGRNLLANTLVIITSDHGEGLGENDQLDHGQDLNLTRIHVPLLMVLPGRIPAGTRVAAPVELRHLSATVLDVTGAPAKGVSGRSLAGFWAAGGDSGARVAAFSHDRGRASLVTDAYHFLQQRGGEDRLFDYRRDYLEQQNLINDPAFAHLRDSLRALLQERLK